MTIKKLIGVSSLITFLGLLAILSLLYWVFYASIQTSAPYKLTLQFVNQNEILKDRLGELKNIHYVPGGFVKPNQTPGTALIKLKVEGELESAHIEATYEKQGPEWVLSDAWAKAGNNSEFISILPLKVRELVFHDHSNTGPINHERTYTLGETIFWTISLDHVARVDNKIHLTESLQVFNQDGVMVIDEPDVLTVNEPFPEKTVLVDNYLTVDDPGEFTISYSVNDQLSRYHVEGKEKIRVNLAEQIRLGSFTYNNGASDGPINESAVFKAGEAVFLNFQVTGYRVKENIIHVSEDLKVFDEQDQLVISAPKVVDIEETYDGNEVLFVNNNLNVPIPGKYRVEISIIDHFSEKTETLLSEFSISD